MKKIVLSLLFFTFVSISCTAQTIAVEQNPIIITVDEWIAKFENLAPHEREIVLTLLEKTDVFYKNLMHNVLGLALYLAKIQPTCSQTKNETVLMQNARQVILRMIDILEPAAEYLDTACTLCQEASMTEPAKEVYCLLPAALFSNISPPTSGNFKEFILEIMETTLSRLQRIMDQTK